MTAIVACIMALLALLHVQPAHKPTRVSRGLSARLSSATTSPAQGGSSRASYPCGGWRDLVARYSWNVTDACAVLWCESRGDPDATNGIHHGLMQIAHGTYDPEGNVAQAFAMWSRRGWQPWSQCR